MWSCQKPNMAPAPTNPNAEPSCRLGGCQFPLDKSGNISIGTLQIEGGDSPIVVYDPTIIKKTGDDGAPRGNDKPLFTFGDDKPSEEAPREPVGVPSSPGGSRPADPSFDNPIDNTPPQEPKQRRFEDSELGKLTNGLADGLKYGFDELNGNNRKKRKEAQRVKRKANEAIGQANQAAAHVTNINENINAIAEEQESLTNGENFSSSQELIEAVNQLGNGHNTQVEVITSGLGEIPEGAGYTGPETAYTPQQRELQKARRFVDYANRQIDQNPGPQANVRRAYVNQADKLLDVAEEEYKAGNNEVGDAATELAIALAEAGMSILVPGAGLAKDCYDLITGYDAFTQKKLTTLERSIAFVGVLTGGVGSKLLKVGKAAIVTTIVTKAAANADEAVAIAKAGKAAEGIAEAANKAGITDRKVIDEIATTVKNSLPCRVAVIPVYRRILWLIEDTAYAADCLPGTAEENIQKVLNSAEKLGITNADEAKRLAQALNAPKVNPFELAPTHAITMSNREFKALKDSMQKDGMLRETIKTVTHNGQKYIVDGHHRARAAKELGWKEVPVEEVTLPYLGYKTIDDFFN
jgi:hypothetical protein